MQVSMAVIYVWHGKAYLPVQAKSESGLFVGIEPICVVALNEAEILSALEQVRLAGHPLIPNPTYDKKQKKEPLLEITKAKSWRELSHKGSVYVIEWSDKGVMLEMSRLNNKGQWEYDPNRRRKFDSDVSLQEIIKAILNDVRLQQKRGEDQDSR